MKKTLATIIVLAALAAAVFGSTASASAFPTKTRACSGCHGTSAAVKITLKKISQTTKTARYSIRVTGGSGRAGWAVLAGAKNYMRKTAATGYFTLPRHKTYRVWAVKAGSGAASKALVVK